MRCLFLSSLNMVFSRTHRYKSYLHKRSEAETGRIFYSPLRPAPLSQGIFTNSTDTKDRNGKDFLLPTLLRPEKSFPRLAPPRL